MNNTIEREETQTNETGDATVRERVEQLVSYVETGRIIEAVNEFYADDVVMQENGNAPTVGKAANLEREEGFVGAVAEVHENRAVSVLVDGNRAAIQWVFEFTNQEGSRIRLDQLAYQTWKNGRIVQERFYYDSAAVVQ